MTESKHRQMSGGPGIAYAEITIPDDKDWGTGSYTVVFESGALPAKQVMASAMVHLPQFQITVTTNPNGVVAVMLGEKGPRSKARMRLPEKLGREKVHSLQVTFVGWRVIGALLDGSALNVMQQTGENFPR